MSASALLFVALGGALGSVARALVGWLLPAGRLPWATIAVNIVGSFLIGWLLGRLGALDDDASVRVHNFWVVGVCGGFTTFSAFSWQTVSALQKGEWSSAAGNVIVSLVACLTATWLGWRLAR